ncbi:uncharacterized protein LOC123523932 [Mercenaria mercenaria]|uniref:uncharacterized protein LOC123523932 n=1 Tax=Mercenaria mercenaria TaxID=6596 RepID=UPI00234F4CB7|nr:uncharacterized protein LOC123523932 [Mercenaria mercenaria]
MANTPVSSVPPVKQKKLKRSFSAADIDSEEEEDAVQSKCMKYSYELQDTLASDTVQPSPLKKVASDNTVATSPLADSGYEISVGNTPGSNKPWKYVQPGSSGYVSGYISDSDCGTPAVGQRTPGPFSPDFVPREKKTIVPFSPYHLKSFIQRNFVLIKEEVDPSGIADILNTEGIITNNDVEMIREEKFRVGKCDILLKSIVRSTLKNDLHTPRKVISAFEKEGYGHLFKEFKTEKAKPKEQCGQNELTKKEIKGRFYRNSSSLEDEVDPLLIIDDLVAEEVLSLDEHQDIKNTDFKPKKVQFLIQYILRKSVKDFLAFCSVLERHYPSLADLLKRGESGPTLIDHRRTSSIDITLVKKPVETYGNSSNLADKESVENTEVKFFFVGEGKEEERMIVDDNFPDVNIDLQEEAMEIGFNIPDVQFSSIRINLTSMSRQSQMEFLKMCRESPMFLEKWLQHLITDKQIQRLKEKNIDKMSFQIKLCLSELEQRMCSCKLTKEVIVQHYSSLEKNLQSVDQIIKTFGSFEGFDEKTRSMFRSLLVKDTSGNRTEQFLRKLLDLPDTRIYLCLLEKEMWQNNTQRLKRVIKVQQTNEETKLSVTDLRRNMNFLVDELEPRHFREMLTGLEGSERIVEKIMSTEPRKERCRELLNFIIQKKNTDRFVQELERRNKSHVLEFLRASRQDVEQIDLKEALVANYKRIVDEIEPRVFRQMFVERREIKAKDFDVIYKMATRRQRAIWLMRNILKRNGSTWKCFMDTLEVSGYRHLVKMINNDIDSYKECPRLYQSLLGAHNTVNIEGEFQLQFKQGDVSESALQVFLHRTIYVSDSQEKEIASPIDEKVCLETPDISSKETITKRNRTRDWIQMQQSDRKRERNDYDETEQPTESKQFRPEVALAVGAIQDFSPASSPTFGMIRQGDLADNCSSAPLTRSLSRDSDERPLYEDISPPSSPGRQSIDKPHMIIEAPCSPLNMCQSKRRNSLSDGSSHTSSLPASPSCSRDVCVSASRTEQDSLNSTSRPYRTWSLMRASLNCQVETFITSLLKGNFKSAKF